MISKIRIVIKTGQTIVLIRTECGTVSKTGPATVPSNTEDGTATIRPIRLDTPAPTARPRVTAVGTVTVTETGPGTADTDMAIGAMATAVTTVAITLPSRLAIRT